MNLTRPGLQFHKLDRAKDKSFWSVRVNRDIRVIVHKTDCQPDAVLRRPPRQGLRLGGASEARAAPKDWRSPVGGSAGNGARDRCGRAMSMQWWRAEPAAPESAAVAPKIDAPLLFDQMSEDDLLGYGVPPEWMGDVKVATEDTVLQLGRSPTSRSGRSPP